MDFFSETYDREPSKSKMGTWRSSRVPYKEGTGHRKRCRVIRHSGHKTIVQFIGVWFPRRDRPDQYKYYCALMLALLWPWRLMKDLKSETEHFSDVWLQFSTSLMQRQINIIDSIQYYYKASDQAHKKNTSTVSGALLNVGDEHGTKEDITDEDRGESHRCQEFTEEDIMVAESLHHPFREIQFWMNAMDKAEDASTFSKPQVHTAIAGIAPTANTEDVLCFWEWNRLLKSITQNKEKEKGHGTEDRHNELTNSLDISNGEVDPGGDMNLPCKQPKDRPQLQLLNKEQK